MNKHTPTILVVEDEKSLLKAWAEIFKREGLNVLTALDWQNALNLALKWHPDLLVVDLVMSHSDSLVLIKKLHESKWGQKVPVMYLNGWMASELEEKKPDKNYGQEIYYHDNNWSFQQVLEEVRAKLKLPQYHVAVTSRH